MTQADATSSKPPGSRFLSRAWVLVRDGLPSVGRYRRYLVSLAGPLALVWGITLAYLLFAPDRFDSRMTLILPGTGVGGSINLESIGQATTTTASAFSSPSLSPTENYKRLLTSDIVLRDAARRAGEDEDAFPAPSIKLIDQTNLIEVEMSARTPEQAQRRMRRSKPRSRSCGAMNRWRARMPMPNGSRNWRPRSMRRRKRCSTSRRIPGSSRSTSSPDG